MPDNTQFTSLKLVDRFAGDHPVTSPVLFFAAPQAVAMGDAALALTMTVGGTNQVMSNILFVDPESSGASEDLTLPAEADCEGLVLFIANTGGEGIVIKDDGTATIATLLTAEHAIVFCDGTSWYGGVLQET